MKKKSPPPPTSRRAGFERQLTIYSTLSHAVVGAVAVATTAVATLGTAPEADAQVVNLTGASFGLTTGYAFVQGSQINAQGQNRRHSLALNAGPIHFYLFAGEENIPPDFAVLGLAGLRAGSKLQFAGNSAGSLLRFDGGPGNLIDHALFWQAGGSAFARGTYSNNPSHFVFGANPRGLWLASNTFVPNGTRSGYVGFRLATAGLHAYQYGWLRAAVSGQDGFFTIGVYADGNGNIGAYNLTPGGTIYAGEAAAIPEPALVPTGLALFALGAAGVREHRRRKLAAKLLPEIG